MRLLYILIFLIGGNTSSWSQAKTETISITFDQSTRVAVLLQIEAQTKYKFFFVEDWLGNDFVSGTHVNLSIDEVLTDVFKETDLNFYILNDTDIILTKNTSITDRIHKSFSKDASSTKQTDRLTAEEVPSTFYLNEASERDATVETVRIGKETNASRNGTFTLSGYAKNGITGEPIQDLAIIVMGGSKGSSTDVNGFYEVQLSPGINILETKALGIGDVKKRVIIFSDGRLDFDLLESAEALDEVVVQTNRLQNVEKVLSGVIALDIAEIKNIPLVLGERDILKTAMTLPGITNAGEGAAGFNVRGGGTDQNLILLDDAVIYNPSHFFGIFSALNPFTTGGVTIYKGSIPSEYGGRLSSVFDINTKEANTKKFSGEASIGPVTGNVTLEIPIIKDRSAVLLGVRTTYSDWILNSLDEPSLRNSKASFYDVVAKYNDRIDQKNSISATAYVSNDAFSITSDSIYSYNNRTFSLKWNHKLNEKNTVTTSLFHSQYGFSIGYDGDSDTDFDLGYNLSETGFKLKLLNLLNAKHKLEYGITSKLYVINPGDIDPLGSSSIIESLSIPQERALESALFISDAFKINDKFSIDAGLRFSVFSALGASTQRIYEENVPKEAGTLLETREFDANEIIKTYGGPEARLSARYFLRPDLSIKTSYNKTFQYIHTLSTNTTVSPFDTWKLSDINIEPQRAHQVSLGLFKNFKDDSYELSLDSYYKLTDNILDYKVGAQLLLNETIETEVLQGEGKAYGIELLIKKKEGRLNGWLGYTYSRTFIKLDSEFASDRINNGEFFPSNFDRPHDVSLVANYKFTKRFSFSTNFVYQTGRPVTFPVGSYFLDGTEYALFSDRNKFRIPDFYRLDVSLNIEGNHKIKKFAHSFWNISVYNVLGRNNPYSVFFVTEEGSLKALQSSIFAIPVPTITYNFKF